jgi:hypothetical protein
MNNFRMIYDIRNDSNLITMIQDASLDKESYVGYKIELGLLFGTKEWFDALNDNKISKYVINGIISNIYMLGHNDYPEFEIKNNEGNTIWPRKGNPEEYKVGKNIRLIYIEQKYKRPTSITGVIAKCIIKIEIEK